jgi:hypothetical protein
MHRQEKTSLEVVVGLTLCLCLLPCLWPSHSVWKFAGYGYNHARDTYRYPVSSNLFSYTCVWWSNRESDSNQRDNRICTAGFGRLWRVQGMFRSNFGCTILNKDHRKNRMQGNRANTIVVCDSDVYVFPKKGT